MPAAIKHTKTTSSRSALLILIVANFSSRSSRYRVKLEDGHYVLERVLASEFPSLFRYQVWGFTNSAGNLVKYATGELRYAPLGGGKTRFTWTYRLRPRSILLRPVLNSFVRNQFAPFMTGGVERLSPPENLEALEAPDEAS